MEILIVIIWLVLWILLTIGGFSLVNEIEYRYTVNGSVCLTIFLILVDAVISFFIATWIMAAIAKWAGVI